MRTAARLLAAAVAALAARAAVAQGPMPPADKPVLTLPPVAAEAKPAPPPALPPLLPPAAAPAGGCSTCTDQTPGCTDPGCGGFSKVVGPKNDVWLRYTQSLLWFKPSGQYFPIATNGAGTTLLGGRDVELGQFNTFGASGGMWLNDAHTVGVGMDGFITENRARFDAVSSDGTGLIVRPFTNAVRAGNGESGADTLLVAGNGATGTLAVANSARLGGGAVNLQRLITHCDDYTVTTFFGFRYLALYESFTVDQLTTAAGLTTRITDRVSTRNQFYGGEVGGRFEYRHGPAFLAFVPQVGFGPVHQVTEIAGVTRIGGGAPIPGGLLAAGPVPNGNIGRFVTNRFAVVGGAAAEVGLQVSKGVRVVGGYNFLFLNTVARPAAQLDTTINTRAVPASAAFNSNSGPLAPQVTFDREGFYAHGASLSVEVSY
jgi:hypothetical protein